MHISFVRSVTMDAFKQAEIERMRLGGNKGWRGFFEEHEDTRMRGLTWDDATIAERCGGEVGEEWKERLSAKVEGREYVPGERKSSVASTSASNTPQPAAQGLAKPKPKQQGLSGNRTNTPLQGSRTSSPNPPGAAGAGGAAAPLQGGKAKVDDKYFARLGEENAARSEDLPPSQGGKYGGFGNTPSSPKNGNETGLPDLSDIQRDAMATVTKGWGWFTSTVKNVNADFIQPTAKQVGALIR